jgi:hypothetical protein
MHDRQVSAILPVSASQSFTPRSISEQTLSLPRRLSSAVIESTPAEGPAVPERNWRKRFGKFISLKFALSCGINTAAALATLVGGPVFYVLAGVLCICTTYANYRMGANDLSNTFREGFSALFRKNKPKDENGVEIDDGKPADYLSRRRRIFVGVGIFLSTGLGLMFAALTFQSTIGLVAAFSFLGAVSVALPPLGIVLGIFTFAYMAIVMSRAFSQIAKTENITQKIIDIGKSLVYRQSPRDDGKSEARFIAERVIANTVLAILAGGVISLIVIGQIFTLGACASGFATVLGHMNAASLSLSTLDTISRVVAFSFGLASQIPFILKTSFNPIIRLFTPSKVDPAVLEHKTTWAVKLQTFALTIASGVSAFASAAIALKGQPLQLFPVSGGVGAFLNTFLGNVVNALISSEDKVTPAASTVKPTKPAIPATPRMPETPALASHSTAKITSALPPVTPTKNDVLLVTPSVEGNGLPSITHQPDLSRVSRDTNPEEASRLSSYSSLLTDEIPEEALASGSSFGLP